MSPSGRRWWRAIWPGTTVHDRGEVPAAFGEALREAGVAFEPAEVTAWRGASKREVIERLLARDGGDTAGPACSRCTAGSARCFRSGWPSRARSHCPASARPSSVSGAHGMRVALTTGFDRQVVENILAAVDWAPLLDAWICGEDVTAGRPAPYMIYRAMERCGVDDVRGVAVVGDTRLDLEAGWNAGAPWRVGVLTGAHDRRMLEQSRTRTCSRRHRGAGALAGGVSQREVSTLSAGGTRRVWSTTQ